VEEEENSPRMATPVTLDTLNIPDTPDTTDREIVLEILGGNMAGFQVLVDRYSPWCHYFFRRRFPQDPDSAQDLTQEAFLRAFKYLRSWNPDSSFRAWLRATCQNLARDFFQRDRRDREKVRVQSQKIQEAAPEPSAEVRALEDALLLLPERQRETIELKYFWSCKVDEIAETLGVSRGTVKNDLCLGLRRLFEILGGQEKP